MMFSSSDVSIVDSGTSSVLVEKTGMASIPHQAAATLGSGFGGVHASSGKT